MRRLFATFALLLALATPAYAYRDNSETYIGYEDVREPEIRLASLADVMIPRAEALPFHPGGGSGNGGGGGPVTFTPLHTYYMSATGNNSNNGTSAGTPWLDAGGPATSSTTIDCGDIIIMAPGTYNGNFSSWSQPSTCPSTTGGIDGTGGVYHAIVLCNGNLGSCQINCSTGACTASTGATSAAMSVNANNWAIEGFSCNGNGKNSACFNEAACASGTNIVHHVAFINDVAINSASGVGAQDCGKNHNVPGNGPDYFAAVGNIIQSSNLIAICSGAIPVNGPTNADATAGTHIFIAGNFIIANQNNTTCSTSDGEGMIMDTFDAHAYTGQVDIENNIIYSSSWAGLQVFQQSSNTSSLTMTIHHNTFFNNMVCTQFTPGPSGEINLQINGNFPWTISTYDNIARTNRATLSYGTGCSSTATSHPYAMLTGGSGAGLTNVTFNTGGSGLQNILYGTAAACDGTCDSTKSVVVFNGAPQGTNTYEDADFTNTSDLLTNWVGSPSVSSYTNTAAAMGWNYASQTATSATPIADLVPTNTGTSGKGYQPPGACAANALYPTWLKGIVFLEDVSGTIYEEPGLVTAPCGL